MKGKKKCADGGKVGGKCKNPFAAGGFGGFPKKGAAPKKKGK